MIFGACGGWWAAHKILQGEKYMEELEHKVVMHKMERNRGVLDEKYRAVLGPAYAKYFPQAAAEES